MLKSLHVRIVSPQQLILDAEVSSVSSKNSQGNFDILPGHANFITLVDNQPIIIRPVNAKELKFNFALAIVYSTNDQVNIYTYVSQTPKEK